MKYLGVTIRTDPPLTEAEERSIKRTILAAWVAIAGVVAASVAAIVYLVL